MPHKKRGVWSFRGYSAKVDGTIRIIRVSRGFQPIVLLAVKNPCHLSTTVASHKAPKW